MKRNPVQPAADPKGLRYSFNHIVGLTYMLMLLFYTVYFAVARQTFLSVINGAGMLTGVLCLFLIKRKLDKLGGLFSFLSLIVICTLNLQDMGWSSGFQYYYLCVCPIIFLAGNVKAVSKVVISIFYGVLFFTLRSFAISLQPLFNITANELSMIRHTNLSIMFAGIAANIYHYGLSAFDIKQKPFVLAITDVDNFKVINDSFVHNEGDRALVLVAQCVRRVLRKEDVVARWGGEEFIILLPQTSLSEGRIAMEKVRKAIAQSNFMYKMQSYPLTVTNGVSVYDGKQKVQDLLKVVDTNLYAGKQSGKNCVVA